MNEFETYLCERNDLIDNAAQELIGALTAENPFSAEPDDDPAVPEWSMEIIGEVVEAAEGILMEKVGHSCHPFYSDEVPCYLTGECRNKHCAFKTCEVAEAATQETDDEPRSYDPISEAYAVLLKVMNEPDPGPAAEAMAIEEALGYLGEALA